MAIDALKFSQYYKSIMALDILKFSQDYGYWCPKI